MITNIKIENFKKLECISFALSSSVVIIGPNNSGKSTIFQALCLWEIGVRHFVAAKAQNKLNKNNRVTLNRKDLLNSPVEDARLLWTGKRIAKKENGNTNVTLAIELEGDDDGMKWTCRAEFYYDNAESFSCGITKGLAECTELFNGNKAVHFGFLQAMSGISTSEDKLTRGAIERRMGEGKTAEVLRNICYEILYPETPRAKDYDAEVNWNKLKKIMKTMFGTDLSKPEYVKSSGIISLEYADDKVVYDISSGGRGFLQTLLLFACMFSNPNTVLLLDEPDAHLEAIRQREVFQKINEIAAETNTQIIIASHSEVVLDEAADASDIIALIENQAIPLNVSTKSQSIKYIKRALTEIGWEKYYLAKVKGHVLYLEGSTDLQMLLCFANKLQHGVEPLLRVANVQYTSDNVPETAIKNFVSLQEIFSELKGLALFENIPNLRENPRLQVICWKKRELENYFARPNLLINHAKRLHFQYPQFTDTQLGDAMQQAISDYTLPAYLKNINDEWWDNEKLSDNWLDRIFPAFYKNLGANTGANFKKDYYQLISLMDKKDIPQEIYDKLDAIYEILK
ncbi:MAG: ATP-binding protein [Prevotellaceae bacterium]|jgi:ABC-type multidrug transport system ATPase subunit|nr:ATP-binding protein [Prevotellaceae bacterium]